MIRGNEGLNIARKRIAVEAEARTSFLDLGNLGLTHCQWSCSLQHLRHLSLGDSTPNNEGDWVSAASEIASNQIEAELDV